MRIIKNKKGVEVIWVVLGVALILALSVSLVKQPEIGRDILKYQMNIDRLDREIRDGVEMAVSDAIQKFSDNGFSENSNVWYCNSPFPPERFGTTREVVDSLKGMIAENVIDFLESYAANQHNVDYNFTYPSVELGLSSLADLDYSSLTVSITGLMVKVIDDNKLTYKDFSRDYSYPYRIWRIYDALYSWMETDAGSIKSRLASLMKTRCVAESCLCHESYYGDISLGAALDVIDVDEEDIFDAVAQSVASLNSLLINAGINNIKCSYLVKNSDIYEVSNHIAVQNVENCVSSLPVAYDLTENEFYALQNDLFLDYGSCGFQWINPAGENYRPQLISIPADPVWDFSQIMDLRSLNSDTFEELAGTGNALQFSVSSQKGIILDIDITCSDESTYIGSRSGINPFSATMRMIVSLYLGCGEQDPNLSCTGTGCACSGTIIVPPPINGPDPADTG